MIDREIIHQILDFMILSYQQAKDDVWKLNEIEYADKSLTNSLLGEIEVLSDNIAGIVSHCKNGMPKDVDWALQELQNNSIFSNNIIVQWIKKDALQFVDYYRYIQSIEFLRISLVNYIHQNMK